MSYGYLSQMLEYLTGAYARSDIRNSRHSLPMETNIGRLFGTLAWGLEIIHENADRLKLWDDIDNARGSVLDRYGANFGVARGGAFSTALEPNTSSREMVLESSVKLKLSTTRSSKT